MLSGTRKEFDWDIFWIREVLILGIPVLLTVFTTPRGDDHIHIVRLAVLLATLLGLTLLNVTWASFSRISIIRPSERKEFRDAANRIANQ